MLKNYSIRFSSAPLLHHSNTPRSIMPISCHKCMHYYVTWDQNFPHGCRAMGFKGRRYPMAAVREVMNGKACLLFVAKPVPKKRSIHKVHR